MRARDAVTAGAGLCALLASVFILGGAFRWGQAIVGFFVAVAIAPQILSRRSLDRKSPLVVLLGLAIVLTAIQLLPLPSLLIDAVEPTSSSLRADGASLLDTSPYSSLSVDPPATLRGLTFFVILLGAASLALRMTVTEKGRYRIVAAVALVCGAVALTIGIHTVFGATKLYGFYELQGAHPSVLGPLLNENHLGCLLAMGTVLSLSLIVYRRQRGWMRAGWLLVTAACGMATVATQSRGAVLALFAGCVATGGVIMGQRIAGANAARKRRPNFVLNSLPIAVVAACAVVVMIYASAGGVSSQIEKTTFLAIHAPTSKFMAWKSGITLVEESPWFGVGRGAQESVFTRVHPASSYATYAYVENEYVQAVVDWGIPGALLLGLSALWLLTLAFRRWNDGPIAGGALGALAVVLIQSNVDFGAEMMGIALPLTLVVATLTYVPLREVTGTPLLRGRIVRGLLLVALVGVAALLLSNATKPLSEDHEDLVAMRAPTMEDARKDVQRHPLDYYGYALASQIALQQGDSRGIRLLNHAMRLHPTHSGLHLVAARLLFRSKRFDQAAVEYGAALHGSTEPRKILEEIVTVFPKELAATAIPIDMQPPDSTIIALGELKHEDIAIRWLERILELQPNYLQACEDLYSLALGLHDLDAISTAIRRCPDFEPSHEARIELAQILTTQGKFDNVISLLKDVENWQGLIAEKTQGWLLRCDAYSSLHQWDEARRCLRRLDASGTVTESREVDIVKRLDQINLDRRASELPHAP